MGGVAQNKRVQQGAIGFATGGVGGALLAPTAARAFKTPSIKPQSTSFDIPPPVGSGQTAESRQRAKDAAAKSPGSASSFLTNDPTGQKRRLLLGV